MAAAKHKSTALDWHYFNLRAERRVSCGGNDTEAAGVQRRGNNWGTWPMELDSTPLTVVEKDASRQVAQQYAPEDASCGGKATLY